MATTTTTTAAPAMFANAPAEAIKHDHQAYSILHWGFAALPIIAGIDKFTNVLCNWVAYLSPQFGQILGPQTTMYVVGIVEIVAGLGVAFKPRFFAPVVAVWLWGIIANLLLLGGHYDIAARDFFLSLGAIGLFRLSQHFDYAWKSTTTEQVS
jgi:uncharacterized membrane protein YphA (DoxX/SURF4 family)